MRLFYSQAYSQLDHLTDEMQLLKHAPPPQPQAPSGEQRREDGDWKLDMPRSGIGRGGPLLDSQGRVRSLEIATSTAKPTLPALTTVHNSSLKCRRTHTPPCPSLPSGSPASFNDDCWVPRDRASTRQYNWRGRVSDISSNTQKVALTSYPAPLRWRSLRLKNSWLWMLSRTAQISGRRKLRRNGRKTKNGQDSRTKTHVGQGTRWIAAEGNPRRAGNAHIIYHIYKECCINSMVTAA